MNNKSNNKKFSEDRKILYNYKKSHKFHISRLITDEEYRLCDNLLYMAQYTFKKKNDKRE